MNEQADQNDLHFEVFEARLSMIARTIPYPPAPDVSWVVADRLQRSIPRERVVARRLAWGAALAIILLTAALAVPPVRAAVMQFIQVGAIRIFLPAPTSSPTSMPAPTFFPASGPNAPTSTPASTLVSPGDLYGETTLSDAMHSLPFNLKLPTYPADLGLPQHVFIQEMGSPVLVLVWMDPQKPDQVLFSLSEFGPNSYAEKMAQTSPEYTTVNGNTAVWTSGPFLLQLKNGDVEFEQMVAGHVLVWKEGDITYRLETKQSLEEAGKTAASLK